MNRLLFTFLILFLGTTSFGQFAPQVPLPGNDAISKDDLSIKGWATGVQVIRGWIDIRDTSLGRVTSGNPEDAIGAPALPVLSLGDAGVAVLSFDHPLADGTGPDFAVFENGFSDPLNDTMAYLELAHVAVSSDSIHWITFPSICLIPDSPQLEFDYSDARLIHNLAGKYKVGWGTPFDLAELVDSPNLDIQSVRWIRITDVVGSVDTGYGTYDSEGHLINDPFPTPFATGGFDLSAIAVLNFASPVGIDPLNPKEISLKIWPNPVQNNLWIQTEMEPVWVNLRSLNGQLLRQVFIPNTQMLDLTALPSGVYILDCSTQQGKNQTFKILKK